MKLVYGAHQLELFILGLCLSGKLNQRNSMTITSICRNTTEKLITNLVIYVIGYIGPNCIWLPLPKGMYCLIYTNALSNLLSSCIYQLYHKYGIGVINEIVSSQKRKWQLLSLKTINSLEEMAIWGPTNSVNSAPRDAIYPCSHYQQTSSQKQLVQSAIIWNTYKKGIFPQVYKTCFDA